MNKQNGNMGNNEVCEGMTGPTVSFVAENIAGTAVKSMTGPTGNTVNIPTSHTEHTGETHPAWTAHLCISPSFEAKKLVLEHILYEFQMYLWTTHNLLNSEFSKGNFGHVITNTIIYDINYIAQKTSLRNILYFFHPIKVEDSDIYIKKFYKKTATGETLLFSDTDFVEYFTDVCDIPYWGGRTSKSIKQMLNTIIAHLTDTRFNWVNTAENYEYILGKQEIQTEICTNVKSAIKKFLSKIQTNDGKDIIYKYKATDGSEQFKDIAKELEDKRIQDIITSINQLMTFTD